MGCGVLCHVFENTLYLNCDLMEDSAVPSNMSVPKVPEPDLAATSARAKKGRKPREHIIFPHEAGPYFLRTQLFVGHGGYNVLWGRWGQTRIMGLRDMHRRWLV